MKIIASMTSWSKRINQAHLTIESILNQSVVPDIIEVNLDYENFPNGMNDLPWTMRGLASNPRVQIHFNDKDLHCWEKLLPTWRAHKDDDEEWINITLDDDYNYPSNYVELALKAMEGNDWMCTQHDRLTQGQHMLYRSTLVNKFVDKLTDDLVLDCTLDDYVIYWMIQQFDGVKRGKRIDSVPLCRGVGYSWRRNFYPDADPSKLSQGFYPNEEFGRERDVLRKIGLLIP